MVVLCVTCSSGAQKKVRTALLAASGNSNIAEQLTINELEHSLLADGGISLVDRRQINQTIGEINFELRSGMVDPASAVKAARLLGVPTVVVVRMDGFRADMKSAQVFGGFKWTANVFFQMTTLVIDAQTAEILSAPTAKFTRDNEVLAAPKFGRPPVMPPGPTDAFEDLKKKAYQSVEEELAPMLIAALKKAAPAATAKTLKVAGVRNGQTYLNGGTGDDVKVGDRYQVVRMMDNGLSDPDTKKPILEKTDVCVLTVAAVPQAQLSSGACQGGAAQVGDEAHAVGHP